MESGKNKPIKIALLVRVLFIPVTFKNYALPLSGVSYLSYISTALPFTIIFACLFTFIGLQLKNPEDLLKTRDFHHKTSAEKVNFVLTYIILLTSVIILCYMAFMTRKKLRELEEKEYEEKHTPQVHEQECSVLEQKIVVKINNQENEE